MNQDEVEKRRILIGINQRNLVLSGRENLQITNFYSDIGISFHIEDMKREFEVLIINYNRRIQEGNEKREDKLISFTAEYFIRSINIFIKLFDNIFESFNEKTLNEWTIKNLKNKIKNNNPNLIIGRLSEYIITYLNSLCEILIFNCLYDEYKNKKQNKLSTNTLNKYLKNTLNKYLKNKKYNASTIPTLKRNHNIKIKNEIIKDYETKIMRFVSYYNREYNKPNLISMNTYHFINYFIKNNYTQFLNTNIVLK